MENKVLVFIKKGIEKKVFMYNFKIMMFSLVCGLVATGLIIWRIISDPSNGINYGFIVVSLLPHGFFIYGTFLVKPSIRKLLRNGYKPKTRDDADTLELAKKYYKI